MLNNVADVLVMGAGPAALCIAAELVQHGLDVQAIASKSPLEPWPNTYGTVSYTHLTLPTKRIV